MRRRPRIDLGQEVSSKETARLDRKRKKWISTNKGRPESDNPFLLAIKPDHENFGEPDEAGDELRTRLENLEFGNFPGYFNYRKNAALDTKSSQAEDNTKSSVTVDESASKQESQNLEASLSDERIKLMKKEWFIGRDVLDIGCNRGHITYAIARLFSPKFILGIDVDLKMVQMANRDLHLHLEEGILKQSIELRLARAERLHSDSLSGDETGNKLLYTEDEDHFLLASYISHGPLAATLTSGATTPSKEFFLMSSVEEKKNNQTSSERVVDSCDGVQREPVDDNKPLDSSQPLSASPHMDTAPHDGCPSTSAISTSLLQMEPTTASGIGDKIEKTSIAELVMPSPTNQRPTSTRLCNLFPNNILFVEHNYVPANDQLVEKQKPFFDTIVCLSVTKWIHLNYRDSGLKRFFKRIYKHLRDDGLLILEAQPFDNYGRRKKLSDRLRANYYSISLKPEQFDDYLLGPEIGFKRILYSTTTDHKCAGFKRPLKVFQK